MFGRITAMLADARRELGVSRALPALKAAANIQSEDVEKRLRLTTEDLFAESVVPSEKSLDARVSGEPVLDRGFSRSVGDNQVRSLVVSILVVLILLLILFRSLPLALFCRFPALLSMAILFGLMGAAGVPIDLGTSMVAGIATGAGSDFAMHYMWYLKQDPPDEVSRTVGPVMVVAVLLVALGFIVLALGRSPVMRLFGILAGGSMALSAFLTCLLLPAFLNKFPNSKRLPGIGRDT
jgi:predicted RND superfamily exporter protein